jgi:hypothetical protein
VDEEFYDMASFNEERTSENAGLKEVGRGGFNSRSIEEVAENPGAVERPADETNGTT